MNSLIRLLADVADAIMIILGEARGAATSPGRGARGLLAWLGGAVLSLFALLVGFVALAMLFFALAGVFTNPGGSLVGGAFAVLTGVFAYLAAREAAGAFRYATGRSDAPATPPAAAPAPAPGGPTDPRQLETRTASGAAETVAAAGPAASDPALVGRRFEVVRRLGEGGMGLVYAGRDLQLGRFVAIKRMRPEIKLNKRDKERFLREARLSASLHHPCIVDIYDVVEQEGEIYLVFEFVDGENMDKRLDRGPITAGELKGVLPFICHALSFAHAKKVVHRDLKPSNIMMTRQGYAKVMDFGIAREIKDTCSRMTNLDTSGTLAYMSPEQELGHYDARSDIFSLGVTLYEALAGQLPFTGPNFMLQKERMAFAPLAETAPKAPAALREAIERCLRHDPKERFQSVAEFAASAGVAADS